MLANLPAHLSPADAEVRFGRLPERIQMALMARATTIAVLTCLSSVPVALAQNALAQNALAQNALAHNVLAQNVLAHNVEVATDVGAMMHIEPNHNPKSGEPARAWFVLTRQGGEQIPFEQCDCRLAVYAEPSKPGDAPILQPPLTPIAAEKYRDIPGATIVFPQSGQYTLALSGKPNGTAFQPFELRYSVTVTAGAAGASPAPTQTAPPAAAAQPAAAPNSAPNSDLGRSLWLAGAGAIGVGIAGALLMKRQKK